jgi:hypothetical protein
MPTGLDIVGYMTLEALYLLVLIAGARYIAKKEDDGNRNTVIGALCVVLIFTLLNTWAIADQFSKLS